MDTEIQKLIIKILGFLAVLSLLEVLTLLILIPNISDTITTQIILIASNIIGLLGGFIAGKTLTEKQQETLTTPPPEEETPLQTMTDQEIIEYIENIENQNT